MSSHASAPQSVPAAARGAVSLRTFARRPAVFGSFLLVWALTLATWFVAAHLFGNDSVRSLWVVFDLFLATLGFMAAAFVGWRLAGRGRPSFFRVAAAATALTALAWNRWLLELALAPTQRPLLEYLRLFPMEFAMHAVFAAVGNRGRWLLNRQQERVELTRLAALVAQTRARSYQSRLQPEFVLQCLDAISRRAPVDPADAERLLLDTADLLRLTVNRLRDDWVPLSSECEFIEIYFALCRDVHGDGSTLRTDLSPEHERTPVPSGSLSALFNHLQAAQPDSLLDTDVSISAQPVGEHLRIEMSRSVRPGAGPMPAEGGRDAAFPHGYEMSQGGVRVFLSQAAEGRVWMEVPWTGGAAAPDAPRAPRGLSGPG